MTETIDLAGRVALVTGGSKNIGRSVAEKLASAGASVAITWQQNEQLAVDTCKELQSEGLNVVPVQIEATELSSIERGVAEVTEQLGPVDILVNNAAIRPPLKLADITPEWWDRIMNTNARGPFFLCKEVLPSMMERGFGRIIFLGGIASLIGSENTARDASKTAAIGIMRSISRQAVPHGVTINIVHPGFVDTKHDNVELYGSDQRKLDRLSKLPIGYMSSADDSANMILFLVSPRARYVSGQEIFVTGGMPPGMAL